MPCTFEIKTILPHVFINEKVEDPVDAKVDLTEVKSDHIRY